MQEEKRTAAERLGDMAAKLDALGMSVKGVLFFVNENGIPADPERLNSYGLQIEDELQAISRELAEIADGIDE